MLSISKIQYLESKLVGNILGSSLMASKYSVELTNLNYKEGMSNDKKKWHKNNRKLFCLMTFAFV